MSLVEQTLQYVVSPFWQIFFVPWAHQKIAEKFSVDGTPNPRRPRRHLTSGTSPSTHADT